jgi:hypothetical protein
MIENLNAECKMLIISILKRYGNEKPFSISISSIVKMHFTTRDVATNLFKLLRNHKYIDVNQVFSNRGKRRNSYTFTQAFKDELEKDLFVNEALKSNYPAVKTLIKSNVVDSRKDGGNCKLHLRSSNRLFLIIFILYADDFGVLANLSNSDISKLMGGISRDRFKSQLKCLYDTGVLDSHVSGIVGKEIFGRLKSKYFLNLSHPLFGQRNISSIKINFKVIVGHNDLTEARIPFDCYRKERNATAEALYFFKIAPICIQHINITLITEFFENKKLLRQFQAVLFEFSSKALSANWIDPEDFNFEEHFKGHRIFNLITPSSKLTVSELSSDDINKISKAYREYLMVSELDDAQKNNDVIRYIELIKLFLSFSIGIAQKYKAILQFFLGKDFHPDKLVIIPSSSDEYPFNDIEVRFLDGKLRNNVEFTISKGGILKQKEEGVENFNVENWLIKLTRALRLGVGK